MQRMIASPLREWRQRDHASQKSDCLVQGSRTEERAMSAVVHENERPHEEAGRRQNKNEGEDRRPAEREVNRRDDEYE